MESVGVTQPDHNRAIARRIRNLIRLIGKPEEYAAEADDIAKVVEQQEART